ncbi:2290_t:CDS:2, partial [Funneliformis geosporum]
FQGVNGYDGSDDELQNDKNHIAELLMIEIILIHEVVINLEANPNFQEIKSG